MAGCQLTLNSFISCLCLAILKVPRQKEDNSWVHVCFILSDQGDISMLLLCLVSLQVHLKRGYLSSNLKIMMNYSMIEVDSRSSNFLERIKRNRKQTHTSITHPQKVVDYWCYQTMTRQYSLFCFRRIRSMYVFFTCNGSIWSIIFCLYTFSQYAGPKYSAVFFQFTLLTQTSHNVQR